MNLHTIRGFDTKRKHEQLMAMGPTCRSLRLPSGSVAHCPCGESAAVGPSRAAKA
jgi:hypothetical protein